MYNFVYSCQLTLLGTHTAEWRGYGAAHLMACDWLDSTYTKAFVGCNRKDVHLVVIGDWYTHTHTHTIIWLFSWVIEAGWFSGKIENPFS